MTTVRSAKSKGSQYEMSCRDSLQAIYPDILLTKQEGFVQQYDLVSHQSKVVIECKRHKGFTWNDLVKTFNKLYSKAPTGYTPYLLFQGNGQPCLVMYNPMIHNHSCIVVIPFEDMWHVPFVKHVGKKKKEQLQLNDDLVGINDKPGHDQYE